MKKSILLLPILLVACANNQQVSAITRPTTIIEKTKVPVVLNKISEICDRRSWHIEKRDNGSVTCSQMSPIMAQALYGTKYGTDVRSKVQFSTFEIDKGRVKVSPHMWLENETAFGQTNVNELNLANDNQTIQDFLNQVKLEIERK